MAVMEKKRTAIEEIKSKYPKVKDKTALWIAIGEKVGILPLSVKNNYFSKLYAVPKDQQKKVLREIERQLLKEIKDELR